MPRRYPLFVDAIAQSQHFITAFKDTVVELATKKGIATRRMPKSKSAQKAVKNGASEK
jgi:hypothetical protein